MANGLVMRSPACSVHIIVADTRQIHIDYWVMWRKRDSMATLSRRECLGVPQPLFQEESTQTLALTGSYHFSGHITSRMVLIYYAQVHCRWLHFTDNKGQNAANYFKQKDVTDQGGKWLNWLYSILGRFSTDFRKLKVLSKFLLPQPGWGSFSKSKSHSTLGTMQAWLPMGEPVRGRGPVCWTSHPLAFPSGSWATFPTRGTVPYMGTC